MRRTILTGGLVFTGGELVNTEVLVVDERIAAIGDGLPREGCDVLNLEGNILSPGFIDVHTHGGDGVDINAADYQQLAKLSRFFASQGRHRLPRKHPHRHRGGDGARRRRRV